MLGADHLVRSLIAGGVELCLGNPGTSEMHFIAALDRNPGLRCVLTLFEGVATGAADGYARLAGKPAATLMHLGPGLANGLCNLHNARRARVPLLNIVGEHAAHHRQHDAPLHSDVEAVARPFSDWVRTAQSAATLSQDCAAAIAAARTPPGRIATLILPADTAWTEAGEGAPAALPPVPAATRVDAARVEAAARTLRSGEPAALLIGGDALLERGLELAHRIAAATGCRVIAPMSNARIARGRGRPPVPRIPFAVDAACAFLGGLRHVLMVGAKPPVAFFAYPDKPSLLTPPGCALHPMAGVEEDAVQALADLVDTLDAPAAAGFPDLPATAAPDTGGRITGSGLAALLARRLPEDCVVIDEALSLGFALYDGTHAAAPHDWLQMAGGATGEGLPLAVGAALARPDRKIVCLQADGSGLYTVQALWTMAREGLDVTVIVLSNRAYATLTGELAKVGARNPGPSALGMIRLDDPAIGWPELARGFGIPGTRAATLDEAEARIAEALSTAGPALVDILL